MSAINNYLSQSQSEAIGYPKDNLVNKPVPTYQKEPLTIKKGEVEIQHLKEYAKFWRKKINLARLSGC